MKPSAPAIALPVFTFSANTTAQKPFTLEPILRRYSPNSDVCAGRVDFHGVDDWPSCSFTAATSISRKPLISPRVWRGKGVEIEQLIFPDEIRGFLLSRNWPAAYHATGDFFDRRSKVLEK